MKKVVASKIPSDGLNKTLRNKAVKAQNEIYDVIDNIEYINFKMQSNEYSQEAQWLAKNLIDSLSKISKDMESLFLAINSY